MDENFLYDLIVVGGGTSGVAAAVSAARQGAKTLLIEKNSFLGGAMTAGLVVPMMKTISSDDSPLLSEVLSTMRDNGYALEYLDGNKGWFSPEMMKCVLDDICQNSGVDVVFDSIVIDVLKQDKILKKVEIFSSGIKQYFRSKYFIDATGDANLASLSGVDFASGDKGFNQAVSLRFNMSGVDTLKFSNWIESYDEDRNVTTVFRDNDEIQFSTAYTSQPFDWALRPIFEEAINEGILTVDDAHYFQIFSVAGQVGTVAFNCPRIPFVVNPLSSADVSKALLEGRKAIRRIALFCNLKLPGFETAYVSNIASSLGVRDSRRIKGKYTLTKDDIGKKFPSSVVKSDYPFDIHSSNGQESILFGYNSYEVPVESLMVNELDNLFVIGRCISTDFMMQSSVRVQPTCFAMGEFMGKYVANFLS